MFRMGHVRRNEKRVRKHAGKQKRIAAEPGEDALQGRSQKVSRRAIPRLRADFLAVEEARTADVRGRRARLQQAFGERIAGRKIIEPSRIDPFPVRTADGCWLRIEKLNIKVKKRFPCGKFPA